mgnify:CR=1 FL=1
MSFDVYRGEYPLWIANRAEQPNTDLEVRDKFSGDVVTRVALADEAGAGGPRRAYAGVRGRAGR